MYITKKYQLAYCGLNKQGKEEQLLLGELVDSILDIVEYFNTELHKSLWENTNINIIVYEYLHDNDGTMLLYNYTLKSPDWAVIARGGF